MAPACQHSSNWQKLLAGNVINDPLQKPTKKRKRQEEAEKEKKAAKGGKGGKGIKEKKVHTGEIPVNGVTRSFFTALFFVLFAI